MFAARLRPDGNHGMQLRFTVPVADDGPDVEATNKAREYLGSYCALRVREADDEPRSDVVLHAMANGYAGKVRQDGSDLVLSFLAPLKEYSAALANLMSYLGERCAIHIEHADPQLPLPWGKKEDDSDDGAEQMPLET